MTDQEQVQALQSMWPGAQLMQEGGHVFAFLPQLRFIAAGQRIELDALLSPRDHSGYPNRLFFERQIASHPGTWYTQHILARPWHTISWRGVRSDQPWTKILAEHLRPFL